MSLKFFHIFFISLSTLCAFGFSIWLFLAETTDQSSLNVLGGIASALAGIGLIVYGVRFLQKFKNISFM